MHIQDQPGHDTGPNGVVPAYGIVFCGPPGQFAIWRASPDGRLLSREIAEMLGQLAVRAGAADYRVFPLELRDEGGVEETGPERSQQPFLDMDGALLLESQFRAAEGVPSEQQRIEPAADQVTR